MTGGQTADSIRSFCEKFVTRRVDVNATPAPATAVDIDALDVSDAWRKYFKTVQKYGGPATLRALPSRKRKTASSEVFPPIPGLFLAYIFGVFYYIAKGMWKKGLVLLAITLAGYIVLAALMSPFFGPPGAGMFFVNGMIFSTMAPRDYYAFKIKDDKGWLPVWPF